MVGETPMTRLPHHRLWRLPDLRLRWLLALGLPVLVAGCQRPTQSLIPPPLFDMQQPADAGPPANALQPAVSRDADHPAMLEDFETFAGSTRILFARNSAELDLAARAILDRQAQWLVLHPEVRASLQGHADELATREQQFALGERRAAAMKFYLTAHGVAADRLLPTSFGKERPAATGSDEASQSRNRRGETVLVGLPATPSR
ncbi:OmpA family protein [Novosphingobium sp.]|uniref:OmpA family protein n=1 Tax=Novosphingobium sp. TaxID=1874826 RepID=UPI0026219422|nr:OmpA family protein [Novosphingobium sp.]